MIILTSALDLVGPSVPKGVVLLADVVPSFLTKLVAPYFIHAIPYHVRILIFVTLSTCGMLLIALTPASRDGGTIAIKMVGVLLASLSSGGGELSFLGLTHHYGPFSLAAWGSGTGGAGLIGAGAYVVATTTMGLSVRTSLLAFSFLPIIMLVSFFVVLPRRPFKAIRGKQAGYEHVPSDDTHDQQGDELDEDSNEVHIVEQEGLLSASMHSSSGRSFTSASVPKPGPWQNFKRNLARSQGLFFP